VAVPSTRVTASRGSVLLVGNEREWPSELKATLDRDGYAADSVADLSLVPSLLAKGRVRALFALARPLGASELLVWRRLREASPRTAIVVFTKTPTDADLKRAFESGATAFLSWPASTEALRHAIDSGAVPVPRHPAKPAGPIRRVRRRRAPGGKRT
jgi:DNA-binding response OmpR family regulator